MSKTKVAVVTGANRGLGREAARQLIAKGWSVVVCGRDLAKAERAAQELGDQAVAAQLNVTNSDEAQAVAELVKRRFGRLDALVNNAGAILEDPAQSTLETDPKTVLDTIHNNAIGPLIVSQAMAPLLSDGGGTITNVSSGMGGLKDMGGGYPGYRLSKASMNALTRILHAELSPMGVRVNAVCPGWVQTDMGGPNATRDVTSGASGIVWAATLGPGGPSGGFFRDGEAIDW